jgi:hypothetical protein
MLEKIEKKINDNLEQIDIRIGFLKKFISDKYKELDIAKNELHIAKLENTIIELESEVKALKSAKLAYETVSLYLSEENA